MREVGKSAVRAEALPAMPAPEGVRGLGMAGDNQITALVLAGSRPGIDPLASAAGVATKALAPVAGTPMIDYVARVLVMHPRIGKVVLMAQQPDVLASDPATMWLREHEKICFAQSGRGISQSLLDWVDRHRSGLPLLVTTADNVLLDAVMIDAFLTHVDGADIAAAMVEREVLMRDYPDSRRTWLRFRSGAWSGANLFWLGSDRACIALEKWREIEQDRKKGWKILSAFGAALLLGAAMRMLTIHQAIMRAGHKLGVHARIVPMPMAEACIDADKPDDILLIERILAHRARS